jgi:hypothetical protein
MAGMLRVSRSRGALSGVLLVLLGIWGGLIPLVGPYVHYAYTPDHAWTFTAGRVWLEILPAAGTLLGGLILLASKFRPMALLGASLAAASGAWFAVGSALAPLWTNTVAAQGFPVGGQLARAMEQIGFFTGLGVAIVCIASVALGRLSLVSIRDANAAERAATVTRPAAVGATPVGATPVGAAAGTGSTPAFPAATEPVRKPEPVQVSKPEPVQVSKPEPASAPMRRVASSADAPASDSPEGNAGTGETVSSSSTANRS